eukprot:gene10093-11947_t
MVMEKMRSFWNHPAGPKTVFFWAPTMKWGIIAANINDFTVTLTGVIWMRYSTQIIPINYNLMTVNAVMAVTGSYQLMRKIT